MFRGLGFRVFLPRPESQVLAEVFVARLESPLFVGDEGFRAFILRLYSSVQILLFA